MLQYNFNSKIFLPNYRNLWIIYPYPTKVLELSGIKEEIILDIIEEE